MSGAAVTSISDSSKAFKSPLQATSGGAAKQPALQITPLVVHGDAYVQRRRGSSTRDSSHAGIDQRPGEMPGGGELLDTISDDGGPPLPPLLASPDPAVVISRGPKQPKASHTPGTDSHSKSHGSLAKGLTRAPGTAVRQQQRTSLILTEGASASTSGAPAAAPLRNPTASTAAALGKPAGGKHIEAARRSSQGLHQQGGGIAFGRSMGAAATAGSGARLSSSQGDVPHLPSRTHSNASDMTADSVEAAPVRACRTSVGGGSNGARASQHVHGSHAARPNSAVASAGAKAASKSVAHPPWIGPLGGRPKPQSASGKDHHPHTQGSSAAAKHTAAAATAGKWAGAAKGHAGGGAARLSTAGDSSAAGGAARHAATPKAVGGAQKGAAGASSTEVVASAVTQQPAVSRTAVVAAAAAAAPSRLPSAPAAIGSKSSVLAPPPTQEQQQSDPQGTAHKQHYQQQRISGHIHATTSAPEPVCRLLLEKLHHQAAVAHQHHPTHNAPHPGPTTPPLLRREPSGDAEEAAGGELAAPAVESSFASVESTSSGIAAAAKCIAALPLHKLVLGTRGGEEEDGHEHSDADGEGFSPPRHRRAPSSPEPLTPRGSGGGAKGAGADVAEGQQVQGGELPVGKVQQEAAATAPVARPPPQQQQQLRQVVVTPLKKRASAAAAHTAQPVKRGSPGPEKGGPPRGKPQAYASPVIKVTPVKAALVTVGTTPE